MMMLPTAAQPLFKGQQLQQQRTNCTAVASAEQSAEVVSFQRFYGSFPPYKNVSSADVAELPPCNSAEVLQFLQNLLQ
jgi:hypothetical protein